MPIVTDDLKFRRAATNDDTSNNGGRVSTGTPYTSGVVAQVFPHVFEAERTAGSTKLRKLFPTQISDGLILYYPYTFLFGITPGGDWMIFAEGTQRDTQGTMSPSRWYGTGTLNTDVSAGGQSIIVDVEDAELKSGTYGLFVSGDKIYISDKVNFDDVAGNLEYLTVDTVTPDPTLNKVTITTVEQLANSYTVASGTKVGSCLEPSDVVASYDTFTVTTVGDGDYDDSAETGYPIEPGNEGAREIDLTLTCTATSPLTFSAVDDESTNWGSWDTTGGDFSPTNPDTSTPLLTMYAAGFSGTWAVNDTITFTLHPASVPIWERRKVPAACGSLANNKAILVLGGQSA